MVDLVGDVAFAQEATAQLGRRSRARVEHLDRGAASVAVRRFVDGGGTPHVEEPVDVPPSVQGLPDTPGGQGIDDGVRLHGATIAAAGVRRQVAPSSCLPPLACRARHVETRSH